VFQDAMTYLLELFGPEDKKENDDE
jgi:hypothetical protein